MAGAAGPDPLGVRVINCYVTDVSASNGTVDYFKWDPEGGPDLANPVISFTIRDVDPHAYNYTIYFRATKDSGGEWDEGGPCWDVTGAVDSCGSTSTQVSVPLAQYLDALARGTYTYEILVEEVEDLTEYAGEIDQNWFKWPYYLWVPLTTPETPERVGHQAWFDEEGSLRASYWLHNQYGHNAASIKLVGMDPQLTERSLVSGPETQGVMHGDPDGIEIYRGAGEYPGFWRVLFTGADECGIHSPMRRTHDYARMPVANAGDDLTGSIVFIGDTEGPWCGAWHRYTLGSERLTAYTPPGGMTVEEYYNALLHNDRRMIEALTNGGMFAARWGWGWQPDKLLSDTGTSIKGSWRDADVHHPISRWCVGWKDKRSYAHTAEASGSTAVTPGVESASGYGFSNIGRLYFAGVKSSLDTPDTQEKNRRVIIAWYARNPNDKNPGAGEWSFFQIVANSWSWDDAYQFLNGGGDDSASLTAYVNTKLPAGQTFGMKLVSAFMLDSGATSQFYYAREGTNPQVEYKEPMKLFGERRRTLTFTRGRCLH
ncbi:MAG TPA: hypothetical protein DGT21_13605 [Armatimonadetes bacterium]|nr:hypothetical protein [Armatimonadota bacterium]